tara:strand:- start:175 stop:948 length:774 start_codon:yes stop_codon:yes gene_type:complete
MIVDSHCHLDFDKLYNQLDDVIARANNSNVKYFLTICTTLNSFEKIKFIVNKYENIYGTFGIHPHETKDFININAEYILNIIKNNNKIIGIGETGLDYYYNHSDKVTQKKSFLEHIKAASILNIPLIVHSRNAELDTYDILKSEIKNSNLKPLMHCFTGTKDFAKKLIDIGCLISISGIVTFDKSKSLTEVVNLIPDKNLLVETDSPFLSPAPLRGKTNEPSHIVHTIKKVAEARNTSIDNIIKITSTNFFKMFGLK